MFKYLIAVDYDNSKTYKIFPLTYDTEEEAYGIAVCLSIQVDGRVKIYKTEAETVKLELVSSYFNGVKDDF